MASEARSERILRHCMVSIASRYRSAGPASGQADAMAGHKSPQISVQTAAARMVLPPVLVARPGGSGL